MMGIIRERGREGNLTSEKDADKEIKGKRGMKQRMQREEQEATARSLPVFIYISQHFQLAAARLQLRTLIERLGERLGERKR